MIKFLYGLKPSTVICIIIGVILGMVVVHRENQLGDECKALGGVFVKVGSERKCVELKVLKE